MDLAHQSYGGSLWHAAYDFPIGTDDLNSLVAQVLGITSSNPGLVDNLFFLYTFVTEAIAAFVVLRWLRISTATAVVCAILFADAPYHLFRGEIHLMLSTYAPVPHGGLPDPLGPRRLDLVRSRPRVGQGAAATSGIKGSVSWRNIKEWISWRNVKRWISWRNAFHARRVHLVGVDGSRLRSIR